MSPHSDNASASGVVTTVRGTVLDVQFDGTSPAIGTGLYCQVSEDSVITAYVHSHLGEGAVRAIAIDSTRGLSLGWQVTSDGRPIDVVVGDELLGRVVDLKGSPLDGGATIKAVTRWPLHRTPPPPSERRTGNEIYSTGIKVIDLFCPFTLSQALSWLRLPAKQPLMEQPVGYSAAMANKRAS
ncbi:ATP synthase subunit beta [Bremerella volcania]|uniref:ATP synthase subunit beta n=1 Tax=Bremerella volcania TaxID=2527984 RepID=A0A518C9A4_9BACT|nr:hypothetical protein [Bremerella volcania]QDU75807.1 ATP synthase subunit beta [Bremerella volcania]